MISLLGSSAQVWLLTTVPEPYYFSTSSWASACQNFNHQNCKKWCDICVCANFRNNFGAQGIQWSTTCWTLFTQWWLMTRTLLWTSGKFSRISYSAYL
jgi:hypothetical protein